MGLIDSVLVRICVGYLLVSGCLALLLCKCIDDESDD